MTKLYVAGTYCVVVGDYLFAMDAFATQTILRADKLTMEVTKSVVRGDYATPWYQRDGTRLVLMSQESASPWRTVFHILDTDMVELSSFIADCTDIPGGKFQGDSSYCAIAGDKIYCYLGWRWSNSPEGYYATFRVYNLDGSYADYSGVPFNGPYESLPSTWPSLLGIVAVALESGSIAAAAYWACFNKYIDYFGTDIVSPAGAPYGGAYDADLRRISAADFLTVTVSPHDYIANNFTTVGGAISNSLLYSFMPASAVDYRGAEWVGDRAVGVSIWKYDLTTMSLVSWMYPSSDIILKMSNAGCITTDGTYEWGVASAGTEPCQIKLEDGAAQFLWQRKIESNAIWFQEG